MTNDADFWQWETGTLSSLNRTRQHSEHDVCRGFETVDGLAGPDLGRRPILGPAETITVSQASDFAHILSTKPTFLVSVKRLSRTAPSFEP
jgi:hypothetical protein